MSTHTTLALRVVASACAVGLVIASAGFGAVFAYRIGIEHSYLLAGLTILFAVALEGLKPLAISAAFDALSRWQIVRGLSMLLLGGVAVAYSLTSELALMSASRGDLAAVRASGAFAANAAADRYQRAQQELASLKPARPVAELEALVARSRGKTCAAENGTGRWVCPPSPFAPELGRAKRRAELETIIVTSSESLVSGPSVKVADPGASSLATYLGALGLSVSAEVVATWLNLVPVLALELGSALAVVLVASIDPKPVEALRLRQVSQPIAPGNPPLALTVTRETISERDRVAIQIVGHLKANGGSARGSHRAWGKMLGADRNTVGRALNTLAAAGTIALATSKAGTVLRLNQET